MVPGAGEAGEKNFNMIDELVDEGLVERVGEKCLLSPQLNYLDMLYAGQVVTMVCQLGAFVLWKRLRHFLSVLSEPVSLAVLAFKFKFLFDNLVDLFFLCRVELADKIFEIFNSLHLVNLLILLVIQICFCSRWN